MNKSKSGGFSLLELLIVVAIILIIATIAIPSLLRSRQAANESGAVATLRTINTAQITYLSSYGGEYGDLDDLAGAGLLDDRFTEGGTVGSYDYDSDLTLLPNDYLVFAIPASATAGRFGYYSGPDAVVRYSSGTGVTLGAPVQ